jgi:hypothetical protein
MAHDELIPNWTGANCRNINAAHFFPTTALDWNTRPIAQLCAACTIRNACLNFALDTNERFGIWAGLSPTHRRQLRAQLRRMNNHDRAETIDKIANCHQTLQRLATRVPITALRINDETIDHEGRTLQIAGINRGTETTTIEFATEPNTRGERARWQYLLPNDVHVWRINRTTP